MNLAPIIQDVVLVGGGHSHVIFIRMWAMQPIPGVRLTLISEKVDTPYSGMLPGLIAGHYSEADVHVDLARLCSWANVRFIEQRVNQINLKAKSISVSSYTQSPTTANTARPAIAFDVLSLDTGSTPELGVDGAEQFSVPVKPVHGFFQRWQSILKRLQSQSHPVQSYQSQDKIAPEIDKQAATAQPETAHSETDQSISAQATETLSIGVVGSGAGGFELIMAMRHALSDNVASCHWVIRGDRVVKERPPTVSQMALQAAKDAGVVIHTEFDVVELQQNSIYARDGRSLSLDEIVWCAAAKAPDWPRQAGLSVDKRGFVLTNPHLQSISADFVFATGDIGTQQETPSDKAGVFAVRQAPVLFQNIRRYLLGKKLKVYRPQKDFLSLMATGKKSAIGNRGFITAQGAWVWRAKDAIDQKFMNRFRLLPEMKAHQSYFEVPQALLKQSTVTRQEAAGVAMRCRGCGGKVGATILDSVLQELESVQAADVLTDLRDGGDAAIVQIDSQPVSRELVQSVDQISAVCADPYVFGRIAAVHALSDVVAGGAIAHSAQVLVSLPFADQRIVKRDLRQLMAGVVDALNEDGCSLIGGHTSEDTSLSLGFVVNGFRTVQSTTKLADINEGDHLILTKPLGSGIILAGMMRQLAVGVDVQQVLAQMQQSNREAALVLHQCGVKAVTDVTGFGLLGHLFRLLAPYGVGATLQVQHVPVFNGAIALARSGVGSTLLEQNQHVLKHATSQESLDSAWQNILCDPQTSGGLLGIMPATRSDEVLLKLQDCGYESTSVIGSIVGQDGIQLEWH